MTPATETTGAVVLTGFSALIAAYLGENLFATIIPTLIGVALHVDKRREQDEITLGDLLRAAVVAGCVGFWGGPWIADFMPSSRLAIPFMCFLTSYYAPDFIRAAHHFVIGKLGGDDNAHDK